MALEEFFEEEIRKAVSEEPEEQEYDLGPTWWFFDSESGMDDIADQAGDSLDTMIENLGIEPLQTRDPTNRLFLARFEFPKYGADFQYPDAVFVTDQTVNGFIDFLAGFPIDDVEMLLVVGQYSTLPSMVTVQSGSGRAAAPVPADFFTWKDKGKIILNLTALPIKDFGKILAPNLSGQLKPKEPHWWYRINLTATDADGNPPKWPVPGEFLALGVRMMPDVAWGKQLTSPFMYSGNFCDTVFYSSGVITEIIAATAERPYPQYKVRWRVTNANSGGIVTVTPTDFATYKVNDRVTILKSISTTKTSQTWQDDDMKTFGDDWVICPLSFYGLDTPATPVGG